MESCGAQASHREVARGNKMTFTQLAERLQQKNVSVVSFDGKHDVFDDDLAKFIQAAMMMWEALDHIAHSPTRECKEFVARDAIFSADSICAGGGW